MIDRAQLKNTTRWVVKIGSSLLTDHRKGLNRKAISQWVEQIAQLRQVGVEVILVSSGSIAEGISRLNLTKRPDVIHQLQAAAAVGQMGLIQAYESEFQQYGLRTAQVLLTHDDLSNRKRYLNARSTLMSLLEYNVIPVINENDTVVTDEIRFGDNDNLAALVTNLVTADLLVILTDQRGMYESDPRANPQAKLIDQAASSDPTLLDMVKEGSVGALGRGGMKTKVEAAKLAARSGATTIIAGGYESDILWRLRNAEPLGTLLYCQHEPVTSRKRWLAGHLQTKGSLVLDAGAVRALTTSGKSLLPVGVKQIMGEFSRGEVVSCITEQGQEIARGLVNYTAEEARKVMGHSSDEIAAILGYVNEYELIHRDNLALL